MEGDRIRERIISTTIFLVGKSLFFLLLLATNAVKAQTAPGKYWVHFSDKDHTPFSLQNPNQFLSEKSIERRIQFNLGFDERDLPVDPDYIQQVLALGNCSLHNTSKWMNAITINVIDTLFTQDLMNGLSNLPFVLEVKNVGAIHTTDKTDLDKWYSIPNAIKDVRNSELRYVSKSGESFSYGPSFRQAEMLNTHLLHQAGYTGEGMDIAVLDGGWFLADQLPVFDALRNEGRIIATRDFVTPENPLIYGASVHGMFVLSHMAGIIQDSLVGTAPNANYYLARTEDVSSEYLVEEDNWVSAAEWCDSLGIDIINSSLGYSVFDDSTMNHTYADMNGHTTRVSIAANIAASKGILVCNSAGNEGSDDWHFITAPSDGDLVMCVGAVNSEGNQAEFSGFGPSSDGDIKPNAMAMGQFTVFADIDSTIRTGNGTSFSSPILAGSAACLWQAFPACSARDIYDAIERSASLYLTPNDSMGYGIPDLWKAYQLLQQKIDSTLGDDDFALFPNPSSDQLTVRVHISNPSILQFEVINAVGQIIYSPTAFNLVALGNVSQFQIDIHSLSSGNYILRVFGDGYEWKKTFQKIGK